jgi:hypothetical protein
VWSRRSCKGGRLRRWSSSSSVECDWAATDVVALVGLAFLGIEECQDDVGFRLFHL